MDNKLLKKVYQQAMKMANAGLPIADSEKFMQNPVTKAADVIGGNLSPVQQPISQAVKKAVSGEGLRENMAKTPDQIAYEAAIAGITGYHGTKKNFNHWEDRDVPTWFTDNKEYAKTYTGGDGQVFSGRKTEAGDIPEIKQVDFELNNPIDLRKHGDLENEHPIKEVLRWLGIKPTNYFTQAIKAKETFRRIGKRPSEDEIKRAFDESGIIEKEVPGDLFGKTIEHYGKDGQKVNIFGTAYDDYRALTEAENNAIKKSHDLFQKQSDWDLAKSAYKNALRNAKEKIPAYEIIRREKKRLQDKGYDGIIAQEQGNNTYGIFDTSKLNK